MSLNENQKRAIYVALVEADEMMSELERLSLNQSTSGILPQMDTSLPELEQHKIIDLVHQVRKEIKAIVELFQLQPKIRKLYPQISGIINTLCSDLEDVKSAKLSGYGTVDPSLKDTLDPHLDWILELLLSFQTTDTRNKKI